MTYFAKKEAPVPFMRPEPIFCINRSVVLAQRAKEEHQRKWRVTPGHIIRKRLMKGPNSHLTRSLIKLNQEHIRRVVAFITVHGRFRKHPSTIGFYWDDLLVYKT